MFTFPYTKNWLIVVWKKKNNFPAPRKRKCKVSKLICEKISIYFSGELRWRKKAPFFEACAIVTCEIVHSEDVECNIKEWP